MTFEPHYFVSPALSSDFGLIEIDIRRSLAFHLLGHGYAPVSAAPLVVEAMLKEIDQLRHLVEQLKNGVPEHSSQAEEAAVVPLNVSSQQTSEIDPEPVSEHERQRAHFESGLLRKLRAAAKDFADEFALLDRVGLAALDKRLSRDGATLTSLMASVHLARHDGGSWSASGPNHPLVAALQALITRIGHVPDAELLALEADPQVRSQLGLVAALVSFTMQSYFPSNTREQGNT